MTSFLHRLRLSILIPILLAGKAAIAVPLDLHDHLFMKDGMGPLVWGNFDEPVRAKSSGNRLNTKMSRESLDPSGLKLIVVSLYAHPIMTRGEIRESLLRQIERAEDYVAHHPDWIIAGEPGEARAAIAAGKRVFVLSIETAAGTLETPEDRDLFINRKKVRIVTFMHLTPDRLGRGVALWPGVGFFNAPLETIEAWITKNTDSETGAYVNPYGLSNFGKTVLSDLVQRGVWIDLSHSSDKAQKDILAVLDRVGQPSLFTHTKLRELAENERTIPGFSIARVKSTGGILGLIPTDDMTRPLRESSGLPKNCREGMRAFAEEWKRADELTGQAGAVTLGSDFNAPLPGLKGGCAEIAQSDPEFAKNGFYRGDDLPKLFSAFREIGIKIDEDAIMERFLTAWEKVRKSRSSSLNLSVQK